jgi:hypothetical protein
MRLLEDRRHRRADGSGCAVVQLRQCDESRVLVGEAHAFLIGTTAREVEGVFALYAEMTISPDDTCGVEPAIPGRLSRIQFAAAVVDSCAPASSS